MTNLMHCLGYIAGHEEVPIYADALTGDSCIAIFWPSFNDFLPHPSRKKEEQKKKVSFHACKLHAHM